MIKRLGIVAKNKKLVWPYMRQIQKSGFSYRLKSAEIILCLGGDGTFLEAERKYPGIPKLLIRDSEVCDKCNISLFDNFLDIIVKGKYKIETHDKLECYINKKKTKFIAVNDIIIRNAEITQAIRFDVFADNKIDSFVGDGIVVSTPYGSTGYYKSITKKTFSKGLGVAFNNIKQNYTHKNFKNVEIKFIINRGRAKVAADNYPKYLKIKPYDEVLIRFSKQKAQVLKIQ